MYRLPDIALIAFTFLIFAAVLPDIHSQSGPADDPLLSRQEPPPEPRPTIY
jgi:hypothetical protein